MAGDAPRDDVAIDATIEATEAKRAADGSQSTPADDLEVVLVAAVAANGVIGDDGELPWYLPEDLRHFRETTMGHPVIAGRRTFESIVERLGEPLPGRTTVVLSRSEPDLPDGAVLAGGVDAALAAAREDARERGVDAVYVIGGATVYEAFEERADRMVLTELEAAHEGDTEFPAWPPGEEWVEVEREDGDGFAFVGYERSR